MYLDWEIINDENFVFQYSRKKVDKQTGVFGSKQKSSPCEIKTIFLAQRRIIE